MRWVAEHLRSFSGFLSTVQDLWFSLHGAHDSGLVTSTIPWPKIPFFIVRENVDTKIQGCVMWCRYPVRVLLRQYAARGHARSMPVVTCA